MAFDPAFERQLEPSLETLRRMEPEPDPGLRERILVSRASGLRTMPTLLAAIDAGPGVMSEDEDTPVRHAVSRGWPRWVGGAAAAGVALFALLRPPQPVEAGVISGTLHLSSTTPRPGQSVTVQYISAGLLGKPPSLQLRARIRVQDAEEYETGIPVVALATLQREKDATYVGRFTLPDSVVYAALAVEDIAGRVVDDFGGRAWEVMQAGEGGAPTWAALRQRAADMMGRSWEEGLATVRRMVRLYSDSVSSWSLLQSYEGWMSVDTDSTRRVHREKGREFDARYRAQRVLPEELPGVMFWYTARGDSTLGEYWRTRLLAEAPRSELGAQERLIVTLRALWKSADTAAALSALETQWADVPPKRHAQVAGAALELVPRIESAAPTFERWTERLRMAQPRVGSERLINERLIAVRALEYRRTRQAGLDRLRELARRRYADSALTRRLWEDRASYLRRAAAAPREPLLALGKALAADGQLVAARDTLRLAAEAGWNTTAFRAYAQVLQQLGDVSGARRQWARVAADPGTSPVVADSLTRRLSAEVGDSAWRVLLHEARGILGTTVMKDAQLRHIEDLTLTRIDGATTRLSEQQGAVGTVVVFWSKDCGPAIEALPVLQQAGARFEDFGFRVITVAEQATRDVQLDRQIADHRFTLPVYLDRDGRVNKAFNNWGTPQIFLLDRHSRLVFRATSDVDRALLQAYAMSTVQRPLAN